MAASIVLGRAIAPVEMAIANWKIFTTAKQARERLDDLIAVATDGEPPMALPEPKTSLVVEGLAVAAPGQRTPLVRNVTFKLKAGDALAILGPSGAGKSSLVRGLVGAWHSMLGKVRLDGAPLEQYPDQMIGAIIGYLPQDVDLFDGTIAENISDLMRMLRKRRSLRQQRPRACTISFCACRKATTPCWGRGLDPLGRPAPARGPRAGPLWRSLPDRA